MLFGMLFLELFLELENFENFLRENSEIYLKKGQKVHLGRS
jgi:hypothetical protein